MHNFLLEDDKDKNPGPFIGDIKFHAFLSFANNQIKWSKPHNTLGNENMAYTRGLGESLQNTYASLSTTNDL